ncbi:MAG: cyclodeaminase/cyclohydrolase family protein [Candidatus Omnitrophica bacterium]|nr:cyclodeaminase/cyclohydrolase family protein [Candidatus Omnitrophota bacterium]
MYGKGTINKYLKELASKSPIPGGGSAAALVGAVGAALLSKVANFTIGKEKYRGVEDEMKDVLNCAEALRGEFMKLCSDDAKAYKKLSKVFKMPKGEVRAKKLKAALKEAMQVPFEVCQTVNKAFELCLSLCKKGNKNLITDVGDAALMLDCAFGSALLNVEINLKSIKDKTLAHAVRENLMSMREEINKIDQEVAKGVEEGIK